VKWFQRTSRIGFNFSYLVAAQEKRVLLFSSSRYSSNPSHTSSPGVFTFLSFGRDKGSRLSVTCLKLLANGSLR
jgi:hypothetical protein